MPKSSVNLICVKSYFTFFICVLSFAQVYTQGQNGGRGTGTRRIRPTMSRGNFRAGTDMGIPGVMTSSRTSNRIMNPRAGLMQVRVLYLPLMTFSYVRLHVFVTTFTIFDSINCVKTHEHVILIPVFWNITTSNYACLLASISRLSSDTIKLNLYSIEVVSAFKRYSLRSPLYTIII